MKVVDRDRIDIYLFTVIANPFWDDDRGKCKAECCSPGLVSIELQLAYQTELG